MSSDLLPALRPPRIAWNKGRIIGQKRPLQPKHVWSIRVRLELARRETELFMASNPAFCIGHWALGVGNDVRGRRNEGPFSSKVSV